MKAVDLIALSFENTTDDCLLQQGAGGGYGATLSDGTTIKATKAVSLNPKSNSNILERTRNAVQGNTQNISSRAFGGTNARMEAARAKAAKAAAGSAGTSTFIAGASSGKGSGKKNRGVRVA